MSLVQHKKGNKKGDIRIYSENSHAAYITVISNGLNLDFFKSISILWSFYDLCSVCNSFGIFTVYLSGFLFLYLLQNISFFLPSGNFNDFKINYSVFQVLKKIIVAGGPYLQFFILWGVTLSFGWTLLLFMLHRLDYFVFSFAPLFL